MTAKVTWSSLAERDLEEIVHYIAAIDGKPRVAEYVVHEIRNVCKLYAEHPMLGEREPRLGPTCRRFTHKRWVIFYRPDQDGIGVVRVIDASRDFNRLFQSS